MKFSKITLTIVVSNIIPQQNVAKHDDNLHNDPQRSYTKHNYTQHSKTEKKVEI